MKRIFTQLWRHIFGSLLYFLPLFFSSLILLDPKPFYSYVPISYLESVKYFFMLDTEAETYTPRNDLYCALVFSWMAVIVVSVLRALARHYGSKALKVATFILCAVWIVLLVLLFLARLFLMWTFEMDITVPVIELIYNTNENESTGFFRTFLMNDKGLKMLVRFLFAVAVVGVADWLWRLGGRKSLRERLRRSRMAAVAVTLLTVLLMPMGVYSLWGYRPNGFYIGQNTICAVISSISDFKRENAEMSERFHALTDRIGKEPEAASCDDGDVDVIFVIGESFIRHHAQIYGYSLPTTPRMQKEVDSGNMTVMSDVVSPFGFTNESLHNMLSLNALARDEKWFDHPFLPQLFHKAGYKTYMFDNQRAEDKLYQNVQSWSDPRTVKASYDYMADDSWNFDKEMMTDIEKYLSEAARRHIFLMIHLNGQHADFMDKSPDEDKVFKPSDVKRAESWLTDDMRRHIAFYDNAALQTDMVMGRLFDYFRNRKAVIFFISDHGEEVYCYRPSMARVKMDKQKVWQFVRCIHEVPCVVWMSDKYRQAYPQTAEAIAKAKDKPLSNDRISHTLLTLGRIATPYYRPEDDVMNDSFRKQKRQIIDVRNLMINGNLDYDSLMSKCKGKVLEMTR